MKNEKTIKIVKEVISYVLIIVIVLLIKKYVFTPIKVNGESMYPTLHHKDLMILNEIGYYLNGLERFDIVVVDYNGEKLIKRVIAFPNEKLEYKNNKLYINDQEVEEDFLHDDTVDFSLLETLKCEVIPNDYYFVVGDNRDDSVDSRMIGLIHKKHILGKTNLIIYPFNRFGTVR